MELRFWLAVMSAGFGVLMIACAYGWLPAGRLGDLGRGWRTSFKVIGLLTFLEGLLRIIFDW